MRFSRLTRASLVSLTLLTISLLFFPARTQAQAPVADRFEENDTSTEAASLSLPGEYSDLTISPGNDPDWYRLLITPLYSYPATIQVEIIATPELDITLRVIGPDFTPVAVDNLVGSPNASVTFTVGSEGFYLVEVTNGTGSEGWYTLRVRDLTPTPTPIPTATSLPTATGTLVPTATSPYPTDTPTPDLGGLPDYTEPSYDFAHAYRIVPGDALSGLNFNSGAGGQKDNDFFVMAVRPGVSYSCETRELGPALDTNIILYSGASTDLVMAGNDDIDTQSGQINSRVDFLGPHEGDVYLLVGYKYPETEDIAYPGRASYTLACTTSLPTETAVPYSGEWSPPGITFPFTLLSTPERQPTATPAVLIPQSLDVLVAYDENDNGVADPDEGVRNLEVVVIDTVTNRELSRGHTDQRGSLHFLILSPNPVRLLIPYLGAFKEVRGGSDASWTLLIPPVTLPGLLP